jgi:predicted transglutaminase-like cysteine proteinase
VSATEAARIHELVLSRFTWAPDSETFGRFEHWQSFADEVEAGHRFVGDCDNFALTCAELALRRGVKSKRVMIATCWTEIQTYHAVAIIGGWMLCNRHAIVMSYRQAPYRWASGMRMSDVGTWRSIA